MHYQNERNYGCRVSDSWTYRGLRTAIIENELLRIVILIDKGADIYQFVQIIDFQSFCLNGYILFHHY